MDFEARMKKLSEGGIPKGQTNVVTAMPSPTMSNSGILNNYALTRNTEIRQALTVSGYDNIMVPDDMELEYVNSVFQSKKLHDMDQVTYQVVDAIGKAEFMDLNKKLTEFTNKLNSVKTPGLFTLITHLNKVVDDSEIETIWNKAVTAKPTLGARIRGIFNKKILSESIRRQLESLSNLSKNRGSDLEKELRKIETSLKTQRDQQHENIVDLDKTFDIYHDSFLQLRKSFSLVVYLEHSFKNQLDSFKQNNQGSQDLTINKKLQDYENVYSDIQNKRLMLHKALLQLPVMSQQNTNLTTVCRNLIKEIDNTLYSSFPMIRGNLANLAIAIMAQNGMMGTKVAQDLENNLAATASRMGANLAVQAETLSSEARLREAKTVENMVKELGDLKSRMVEAKAQSEANIQQATDILSNATTELKQILGN